MHYGDSSLSSEHQAAYNRLRTHPDELEVSSTLLGSGQYGYVWRGALWRRKSSNHAATNVAIKVLKTALTTGSGVVTADDSDREFDGLKERGLVQILLEARIHASLQDENLVQLLGIQDEVQPVMLAMELCEAGDLRQVLKQRAKDVAIDLNLLQRRDMAAQSARGLAYLHQHLCLHRDVAARNILLTARSRQVEDLPPCGYVLKLSDLGLTRVLREESDYYRVRRWGGGVETGSGDTLYFTCPVVYSLF
jgi:serine/threonine protein kinase